MLNSIFSGMVFKLIRGSDWFQSLFSAIRISRCLFISRCAAPFGNAMVATPTHVHLHFSEKLVPAFSKGDVTMAAIPGMAAMKVLSTASVAKDGKTLVITPRTRMASGRYVVDWHVVSTDTHKVAGSYAFTVK